MQQDTFDKGHYIALGVNDAQPGTSAWANLNYMTVSKNSKSQMTL